MFAIVINGLYLARFAEKEKELILRKIKRENTVFYLKLKIIDYRSPPVAKRLNAFGRVKRYSTVILNVTSIRIYDDILDKKVTENKSLKLTRP